MYSGKITAVAYFCVIYGERITESLGTNTIWPCDFDFRLGLGPEMQSWS